ncbi:hypothetical protein [Spiroplasma endosymbiont of Polydrusus pterygomalis]|uniref:hypothetical protein n=1 Tax=Spiroplasma endosymbiont of Polydrusus pterygomalis TaxID=3139327 RepID=UPI003CCB051F
MKEQHKYKTIEKIINNKISKQRAANILHLSIRRIEQLIKLYDPQNSQSFAHHSRGRIAHNKTNPQICEKIINLYKTKYIGFNFTHFKEKLIENEGINISYSVLYKLMSLNQIKTPRKQKIKKKDKTHPLRERRKCFGELLQWTSLIRTKWSKMIFTWRNWWYNKYGCWIIFCLSRNITRLL